MSLTYIRMSALNLWNVSRQCHSFNKRAVFPLSISQKLFRGIKEVTGFWKEEHVGIHSVMHIVFACWRTLPPHMFSWDWVGGHWERQCEIKQIMRQTAFHWSAAGMKLCNNEISEHVFHHSLLSLSTQRQTLNRAFHVSLLVPVQVCVCVRDGKCDTLYVCGLLASHLLQQSGQLMLLFYSKNQSACILYKLPNALTFCSPSPGAGE